MHLGDAHDRGVLTGEKNVRNLEQKLAKVFEKNTSNTNTIKIRPCKGACTKT